MIFKCIESNVMACGMTMRNDFVGCNNAQLYLFMVAANLI